jgi:aspartate/methionine/tyrosine aminotransferase
MFERTKDLKLSIIKQMELRAAKFPDVISLAQGVPSFDTPSCIKRRVERALADGVVARYSLSPGLPELRELIEIHLARENMFYDWQKEILITAGSIEGITATILAITNPGDEIIIPEPTYTSYREVVVLAGCQPVFVPLKEENGWTLDTDKIEAAITSKTKAIFYCNPNNPTGVVFTKEQLLKLGEMAKMHDLFLISDEVYKDFVFNCHLEFISGSHEMLKQVQHDNTTKQKNKLFSLAEIPELRKKVIRLFSFSKTYAMTGWRIGYLHSDEEVASEILKVHDSLVTCAPVVSQYAAMGALEMGETDVKKFRKKYMERRDIICNRLNKLSGYFSYIKPNSTYYVFLKIKFENLPEDFKNDYKNSKSLSWQFSLWLLEKAQVAVVPGMAFGPSGEGHIRMSFGKRKKDINEAFDRIETLLK